MRKQGKSQKKKTIYIVTAKTEREYFSSFSQEYRITIKFERIGDATDPKSILNRAKSIKKRPDYERELDEIYCVFDRDDFPSFNTVCKTKEKGIKLIPNAPCFELWILLHYEKADRPFLNGDEIIRKINEHLPNIYDKSKLQSCFDHIKNDRPQAIERAERLEEHYNSLPETEKQTASFTDVHRLVKDLEVLAAQNNT